CAPPGVKGNCAGACHTFGGNTLEQLFTDLYLAIMPLPNHLRILLASCAGLCAPALVGQSELSVFTTTGRAASTTFVTDYQAIGINPANLGWTWRHAGKHVAFGLAEGSYSVYSNALTRADIRNRLLNT